MFINVWSKAESYESNKLNEIMKDEILFENYVKYKYVLNTIFSLTLGYTYIKFLLCKEKTY